MPTRHCCMAAALELGTMPPSEPYVGIRSLSAAASDGTRATICDTYVRTCPTVSEMSGRCASVTFARNTCIMSCGYLSRCDTSFCRLHTQTHVQVAILYWISKHKEQKAHNKMHYSRVVEWYTSELHIRIIHTNGRSQNTSIFIPKTGNCMFMFFKRTHES